ncbi:tRNA preQ1(34) S-adenosylmethionine ribosyltransferase-isomerase QueA [Paenibacillus yanchengensis]|uniref:S-adenosylmethionine:tRNA ribosyltransferase-isomerase n=1 Tax=Paenibacillus yanchengensis TaxID=2035833 RepID=A0ABW4YL94_9BACL
MDANLFDFELPEHLIAQTPLMERTASRLLALNRSTGAINHGQFTDLQQYLQEGDVLVLNNSRVLPARLIGSKADTQAKVELLLLKQLENDHWEVLAKPAKKVKQGATIIFGVSEQDQTALLTAHVVEEGEMGARIIRFEYDGIFPQLLDQLGEMPLPPYIKEKLSENERYQTVYAKHAGSAAAPTAGLHFTDSYLQLLQERGVKLAYVTLHVGLGTFRPMSTDNVEDHQMHEEYYELDETNATIIQQAVQEKRRIVAVGTTSARTLETIAGRFGQQPITACSGWTNIFIYPGYSFQLIDALLTNFHLPKSTLVMLISALAGRENVMAAYEAAIEQQYRFFSFGDAMFIYEG